MNELLPNDVIDNGHYGHYTEKLVKNAQEKYKLTPNGIVEEECWEIIFSYIILFYFIKKKNCIGYTSNKIYFS